MTIDRAIDPLPPDDEPIRQALEGAHLRSLLPALAQITGDLSLLRDDLRPAPASTLDLQGELPEAARAAARDLALRTLVAWRDAGSVVAPPPSPAGLRRMIDFLIGEPVSDDYLPLLIEELAFATGTRGRRVGAWRRSTPGGRCAWSSSARGCRASWRRDG